MVLSYEEISSPLNAAIIRLMRTVGYVSDDRVSTIRAPDTNLAFVESLPATNPFVESSSRGESNSGVM